MTFFEWLSYVSYCLDVALILVVALIGVGLVVTLPLMAIRHTLLGVNLSLPESWKRKKHPFIGSPEFSAMVAEYERTRATYPKTWICDVRTRR